MATRILRDYRDSVGMDGLSDFQERLFVRMILSVDDFGRGLASNIHSQAFPLRDMKQSEVAGDICALHDAGMIRLYMDLSGKLLFDIPKFLNKPRAKCSKYASYEERQTDCIQIANKLQASCMQIASRLQADVKQVHADCMPKLKHKQETKTETQTQTPNEVAAKPLDDGFLQFWKAYPKKRGRGAAESAWKKAKGKPATEEIIEAVTAQAQSWDWRKDGGQFVPNPATWINQRRWEDEAGPTSAPAIKRDNGLAVGQIHHGTYEPGQSLGDNFFNNEA